METDSHDVTTYEAEAHQEANSWLAEAARIVVDDADTAQAAADWLVEDLAPRRRAVEEWFAPLVAAAHATHKALTQRRAAILARFDEPERKVKAKLATWHQQQIDARAALEAEAGDAALLVVSEPERIDGVAFVTTLKAEVSDFAALVAAAAITPSLLPLLCVDDRALQQLAKALGAAMNVPGVRVVEVRSVRRTG